MNTLEVYLGDVNKKEDFEGMLYMLNEYMKDPMGGNQELSEELKKKHWENLSKYEHYVFFLAKYNGEWAGVANCFLGYSTFKAKQLINIHDFAVAARFRRKGIGEALMKQIAEYGKAQDFCKITLEVRHDNHPAQKLYKRTGFVECDPPMYFWQKEL